MIDKKRLREQLERFREKNQSYSVATRLIAVPFPFSFALFNMRRLHFKEETVERYPCVVFGKQLVLKIIDELLDE